MFREVGVDVEATPGDLTFRFAEPLSVIMLVVTSGDEMIWEIVADEMRETVGSSFSVVPMAEATPEMLEMLRMAQADADARLKEKGPFKPPIAAVRYGTLPPGYREKVPARMLGPGAYHLVVVSEQGTISSAFGVPAA